ncbi:MAG: hypothetical protein LBC20_12820 [Planctomycetaceae bacterium]|nr:hypothetical protein [Planctomycetaceae bacterium]
MSTNDKKTKSLESSSKIDDTKQECSRIIRKHGNRELAIERAENLYNQAIKKLPETPWEINPVTKVYQLVKELQNFFS